MPHRDDELAGMNVDALQSELARARLRLKFAESAKSAKRWHKRIHWLEAEIVQRD